LLAILRWIEKPAPVGEQLVETAASVVSRHLLGHECGSIQKSS
jgi:hypothetical protein